MPMGEFTIETNLRFSQRRFSLVKLAGSLFGWGAAAVVWDLLRPASIKVLDYPSFRPTWADLFNRFGGVE